MTIKQHVTHATELYFGNAYHPGMFAQNERRGVPWSPLTHALLGLPQAADGTFLINNASGPQMPGPSGPRIVYSPINDGTSPFDAANRAGVDTTSLNAIDSWDILTPRNLVATVGGFLPAPLEIQVWGYDQWKSELHETLIATVAGTVEGLKAFRYIDRIDLVSTGNLNGATLSLGTGDRLGLPYRLTTNADVIFVRALSPGEVVSEDTDFTIYHISDPQTPSPTSGDARGTIIPNTIPDGTIEYTVLYLVRNPQDPEDIAGRPAFIRERAVP